MFNKYLSILELNQAASKDEIKKAYRKLAMKYHPDRNKEPNAEEKFKKISDAYQILTGKSQPSMDRTNNNNFGFINPNDLFAQLFGNNSRQSFMNIQPQTFHQMHTQNGIPIHIANMSPNVVNRSSSIQIVNGQKIETVTEVTNGQIRRKRIVTQV